jgi:hypothetical protein
MLKQIKPDQLYFVIKINEPYAKKIFEVLKAGQIEKEDWPEGNNKTFKEWVLDTFGQDGLKYIESDN